EPRGLLAGSERLDAGFREIIDDPGRKRHLRADHDQLHRILLAERKHRRVVGNVERHAFGLACDPRIARRAPEFCHERRRRDLPPQGMFAAAGTEQEDAHEMSDARIPGSPQALDALSTCTVIPDGAPPRADPRLGRRTMSPEIAALRRRRARAPKMTT